MPNLLKIMSVFADKSDMIISDEQLTQVIGYLRTSAPRCVDDVESCDRSRDNADSALIEQLRGELLALPECRADRVNEARATMQSDNPIPADVVADKMIARSISDAIR